MLRLSPVSLQNLVEILPFETHQHVYAPADHVFLALPRHIWDGRKPMSKACSWVSVHPNISVPKEAWWRVFRKNSTTCSWQERWCFPPQVTEEEIEDRSKGDGFSKTIALGQTLWFIVQCIARRAQHLDLTLVELLTLSLAVLYGAMYFFLW